MSMDKINVLLNGTAELLSSEHGKTLGPASVSCSNITCCTLSIGVVESEASRLGLNRHIGWLYDCCCVLGRIGLRPGGGSHSHKKNKFTSGSMQSALSVDMENPEAEKLRREFELFKKNKENEIAIIQKSEKRNLAENKRLRAELQALQVTSTTIELCCVHRTVCSYWVGFVWELFHCVWDYAVYTAVQTPQSHYTTRTELWHVFLYITSHMALTSL